MHTAILSFRPSIAMLCTLVLMAGMFLTIEAHSASIAEREAKLDQLYLELLQNPENTDKTLAYAALAAEIGDYEAAIPPLERLLMTTPGSNKLKLELGIMYYLLGSYDMAKSYFTEVTADANAKPRMVNQANEYLKRM